MSDAYLLETQGFRNVETDGLPIGFEVDVRIGYYRGVVLALINDVTVVVDRDAYAGEEILFKLRGRAYTVSEMAAEEHERWEYGERATVFVRKAGGLTSGAHTVRVTHTVSPSYAPGGGFTTSVERRLTMSAGGNLPERIQLGVSLYSYQREYFTGRMSLADCLREVAAIGATGVQLLPEQMMPSYPRPTRDWVDWWHGELDLLGLRPTVMDTFVDRTVGGHRQMSLEESVDKLVQQMKLAKLLGFTAVRPTTGPIEEPATDLILAALPEAERLDIHIVPEIHAPVRLRGQLVQTYIDLIETAGTAHVGFTLDLGIFCTQLPPAMLAQARRRGVADEIVEYVDEAFRSMRPTDEILDHVRLLGADNYGQTLALHSSVFGPPSNTPDDLASVLPYVHNVHAKFYDIDDSGEEATVPYRELMRVLVDAGYEGSVDSEYEGQRLIQDAFEVDSCEQVRRNHVLMREHLTTSILSR